MEQQHTLWIVVNQASGSNNDDVNQAVIAALGNVGAAPARVVDCAADDLPEPAQLDAAGVTNVACHTGDGTLRALLTGLEGWHGAVLVLPGGTTNLLSKALHGDRPVADIVADLPRMQRRRRNCVRSEAGAAVIEVLAGPGAKWSDVREGLRDGDIAAVASTTIDAASASAGNSTVVLAHPDIGKPDGYSGVRLTPLDGGLEVEGYGADTVGDYLKQGLALMRRDFRLGPHDDLGLHPVVHCASIDGSPIELMLDGERETGPAELTFSMAELDLDLLSLGDG